MKTHKLKTLAGLIVGGFSLVAQIFAANDAVLRIPMTAGGWYDARGFHYPHYIGKNYHAAGQGLYPAPLHNYFTFRIPNFTGTPLSVELRLFTGEVRLVGNAETYQLSQVQTPANTLIQGGSGMTNVYEDLGDGPVYGTRDFTVADQNKVVTIPLQTSFLDDLVAAKGKELALGGQITTLDPGASTNEYIGGGLRQWNFTNVAELVINFRSGAPEIAEMTESMTAMVGTNIDLQVTASGGSLSYQWSRQGQPVTGATHSVLSLTNVIPATAGSYQVTVSNSSGSVTSSPVRITLIPAVIRSAPKTVANYYGADLSLRALVDSIIEPTYTWLVNGAPTFFNSINIYTYNNQMSGDFSLVASNAAGSVTSLVARVVLTNRWPIITTQPQGLHLTNGQTDTLYVSASYQGMATFQWRHYGTNLSDKIYSTLQLLQVTEADAGEYSVVVRDTYGAVTSAVAYVRVNNKAPIFIQQPSSFDVTAGYNVSLSTSVQGTPYPFLQWFHNGVAVPYENFTSLSLSQPRPEDSGTYYLLASNVYGTAKSASVFINVIASPPEFCAPLYPVDTYIQGGADYYSSYSPCVNGANPKTFQWRLDGQPISGMTNESLSFNDPTKVKTGIYDLIVSNYSGVVTSPPGRFVFSLKPVTVYPNQSQLSVGYDRFAHMNCTVEGGPISFMQWYVNGKAILNANTPSLSIHDADISDAGTYTLVAGNFFGAVTSAPITLTVIVQPPKITTQPGDQQVYAGQDIHLNFSYSSSLTPTIRWYQNDQLLPSANYSWLSIYYASSNHTGYYYATVSNYSGIVTTRTAQVNVLYQAPKILSITTNTSVLLDNPTTIWANVEAGPPATYQWYFKDQLIIGESNYWLSIPQFGANHEGTYVFVASNSLGMVTGYAGPLISLRQKPVFSYSPSDQYVRAGYTMGLAVNSQAGPPAQYQWYFEGAPIPGANLNAMNIFNASHADEGSYYIVAWNSEGYTTSQVFKVVLQTAPPQFTYLPQSSIVMEGARVTFDFWAQGAPMPVFSIQRNGVTIPLASRYAHYEIWQAEPEDSGIYTITASNVYGIATTPPFKLDVIKGGPLDQWHLRNPKPQGNHLLSLAYGDGQWVACGEHGTIITSTNGLTWNMQTIKANVSLKGIAYGDGKYVVVGESGTILVSTNGTQWTLVNPVTMSDLESVTFGNGRFVAAGGENRGYGGDFGFTIALVNSEDGFNWTLAKMPPSGPQRYLYVTYGNGLFVAGGDQRSIAASTNGQDWISQVIPDVDHHEVEAMIFTNGMFLGVGQDGLTLNSNDGLHWQKNAAGVQRRLNSVVFGKGRYVAVGSRGTVLVSGNGVNWVSYASGTPDRLEAVCYAQEQFMAVGENGTTLTSSNGMNWTVQSKGTRRDLDDMTGGLGLLVAVGKYGTIITSSNGMDWLESRSGLSNDLHGIGFCDGTFVAVGDNGVILTSTNATDWIRRTNMSAAYLKYVTYGNGYWVVVGTGSTILYSSNTIDWNIIKPSTKLYDLNQVAFGNGRFVAVGDGETINGYVSYPNGTIFTSQNGMEWVNNSISLGKNLRCVTFAYGRFIAGGNDGTLLTSESGTQWSYLNSAMSGDGDNLRGILFNQGLWTVVGNEGILLTSPDLMHWTQRGSRTVENLHAVRAIRGTLVAIGNRGFIIQSDPAFGLSLAPSSWNRKDGFRFRMQMEQGQVYRVQTSEDLKNWQDLQTVTGTGMEQAIEDAQAWQKAHRFYRVIRP